ncbi:STAS domain-containing protein [Catellatospora sp. KI3]|uniref:STAS domain-containing protein n=1 Tax=Catellatospora sp. KI3 TaxID=3041620 RepID=UPI002482CEBA|nr:STAS domain-containing protein [Catellatospora sp. KI3]MDI1464129.1 STAS domain-containing protein [Catellatospora sp. KI3]
MTEPMTAVPMVEVKVRGDLDSASAARIHDVLQEALALHPRQLVIDLAECEVIDAAGILLLLDAHRRALRDGGAVTLRSPSQRARRNLKLARVDRVLQVLPGDSDEPAARLP